MRLFRFFAVTPFIAGLLAAQVPTQGYSQMSAGFPAVLTAMPRCKTHVPVPYPLLRSFINPGAVSLSAPAFSQGLESGVSWSSIAFPSPVFKASFLKSLVDSCAALLLSSRPIGRAPPINYILFSA